MKVAIGTVHGEEVNGWFFHSMLGLQSWLRTHRDPADPGYVDIDDVIAVRSGPALAMGRGRLTGAFLESTDADALLMVDSDMSFAPETIVAMVRAFTDMRAQYPNVGMLGGLAFISNDPRAINPAPNLWIENPRVPGNMVKLPEYQPDTLYEVAATGAACVIIGRDVIEKVSAEGNPFHHVNLVNYPMLARNLATMDDPAAIEDMCRSHVEIADQLGEDLSFCYRVKQAGYRVFVHTGLRFDHAKAILVGEPEYDAAQAAARAAQEAPSESDRTE